MFSEQNREIAVVSVVDKGEIKFQQWIQCFQSLLDEGDSFLCDQCGGETLLIERELGCFSRLVDINV